MDNLQRNNEHIFVKYQTLVLQQATAPLVYNIFFSNISRSWNGANLAQWKWQVSAYLLVSLILAIRVLTIVLRPSVKFLRQSLSQPWGFVIYRTVYTPASDEKWEAALAKLRAYIYASVVRELYRDRGTNAAPLNPQPCDKVRETYQPMVFQDRETSDGASVDVIRE